MKIQLVDIGRVNPSTYNPRQADPARLDLLELSMRKLGLLLALYTDKNGELSSGHQRHHVLLRMGVKRIPVVFFDKDLTLNERKAINLIFNRGTNDLDISATPQDLTEAIRRSNVYELAAQLPDKQIDSDEFYPCLRQKRVPIKPLLKANSGRWVQYAASISKTLRNKGVVMPVVITPDLKVVNGIGRLQMLAESKEETVDVVIISPAEAALADAMLNLLSMDFDIHTRYADFVRHNSFRRIRTAGSNCVGYGFTYALMGNKPARDFQLANRQQRQAWERLHGRSILDFGAGRCKEVEALRRAGFEVSFFEPYQMEPGGDVIDRETSVTNNRAFLEEVAAGKRWSSIFLSAVLNSVPFKQDRLYIAAICAALAGDTAKLYATANSVHHNEWQNIAGRHSLDSRGASSIGFALGYEPGTKIGDLGTAPKIQKYHSAEEFQELFGRVFGQVETGYYNRQVVYATCGRPRPVEPALLRAALEFEFDLPYPDGQRMGLAGEAIAAFSRRLNIDLN